MAEARGDVTVILRRVAEGDDSAQEQLLEVVLSELRGLAGAYLRQERSDHTLQPTALVHEAWLKLVDQTKVRWESRGHFLAIAATAMRRILTDHARRRSRQKRAASGARVALEETPGEIRERDLDLVALNDALTKLGARDARKVSVVEMRYFGGLTVDDTAAALGVSRATVKRDWEFARLWLEREMTDGTHRRET